MTITKNSKVNLYLKHDKKPIICDYLKRKLSSKQEDTLGFFLGYSRSSSIYFPTVNCCFIDFVRHAYRLFVIIKRFVPFRISSNFLSHRMLHIGTKFCVSHIMKIIVHCQISLFILVIKR